MNQEKLIELDRSTITNVLDYFYFGRQENTSSVFQEVKHIGLLVVAEELGGILPENEINYLKGVSRETVDNVKDVIYHHDSEVVEGLFYKTTDTWRKNGYVLFPGNYEHMKDRFLQEMSSIQKSKTASIYQKSK